MRHPRMSSVSSSISKEPEIKEKEGVLVGNVHDLEVVSRYDSENVLSLTEDDLELIVSHLGDRSFDEWHGILRQVADHHRDDECVPLAYRKMLLQLVEGPLEGMTEDEWRTLIAFEGFLIYDWSIYPEVRFATRPIDESDPDDYENLRTYVIGTFWAMAGCVLDTFFYPRLPKVTIGSGAVQLLIAGTGQLVARLPRIEMPIWRGRKVVLNSGHEWTFKEQTFAMLCMAVSLSSPMSQDPVLAISNPNFYGYKDAGTFGFTVMLTLSTAFLGFGLSGLYRAFCVYPDTMVWYDIMPLLTLNRTLTKKDHRENINGWKLKRYEFFWLFAWLNFGWYWITNLVFEALSIFTWMTWISPTNIDLQAITGNTSGLGLNPIITWDTNVIVFTSLYTPFSALLTYYSGYMVAMLAIIIIWYTNVRWTGYLPINSNSLFDNTAQPYDVAQVLDENLQLDESKYQAYSHPYWSAGNLVNYGSQFMFYPGMIAFTFLNYWRFIREAITGFWDGIKSSRNLLNSFDDRFSRAQRKHKEVPEWWYGLMMLCSIGFSIATVEHFSFTHCPVWAIFLGIGLSIIFLYPANVFRARTTYFFDINVLYELIVGYAMPGNGIGVMVAKCLSSSVVTQADNWINQLAMGHYVGIAPRRLFRVQLVSVVCTCMVEAGIVAWQASGALGDKFCTYEDPSKFYCADTQSYFNSGVQWGTIGPKRVFKQVYPTMKYCFLIGALYPIPFWAMRKFGPILAKRFPSGSRMNRLLQVSWLFNFNEMVFLNAAQYWAPYNWYYNITNFEVGIIWHKIIKKRWPRWHAKYTFLFYNSVSVGNAFAALFLFFAAQYHHIAGISWWGNSVFENGYDANGGKGRLSVPADPGYFGPKKGTFA